MRRETAARVAWSLFGLAMVLAGAAAVLLAANGALTPAGGFGPPGSIILFAVVFGAVGGLVASRRPENPIGWIFLGVAVVSGFQEVGQQYAVRGVLVAPGSLPGAAWGAWLGEWVWIPVTGSVLIFVLLLFPTGTLPSSRWRWVLWFGSLGMAVGIIGGVVAPRMEGFGRVPTPFPIRIAAAETIISIGMVAYLAAAAASVASVVLRYRRSRGEERAQLKWIAAAGGFAVMALAIGIAAQFAGVGVQVVAILMILGFLSIPVAAGIAVLKYRLYEIDVVINRAVVYGLLATFVTGLYIAIVVGIGAAVGRRGGLLLPGVAAAVVALIFHPARLRAQRFANRLVYGKRATPYEVLSRFSDRLAGAYSVDDALPRMARLVAEGTGAARTAVWLAVGEQLRTAATWPSSERPEARALDGEDLPEFPNWDRAFSVRHQGELLGAITITKPPGVPLTPTEEKLLSDVASQAALVLRNVRLLEDLRASRQRLVAAQDEERRRLERNIHDGAQQQLVALAVKLRLAESLVDKDPGRARDLIAEVKAEAGEALDTLRELARGIYPPLLADQGLAAALRAQARKAPVPVTVTAEGIPRLPAEVEASIYFCCLEALQNVAKYAEAREVLIAIAAEDGAVAFRITDDGRGFDPATTRPGLGLQNMRDRVEALGGTFAVTSRSGEGTTIAGRIPLQAAPVAADQAAVSRSGSNSDLGM